MHEEISRSIVCPLHRSLVDEPLRRRDGDVLRRELVGGGGVKGQEREVGSPRRLIEGVIQSPG